ncbi:MAG: oligosaccharide flippase family protein [Woeseiaceae bacterium]
MLARDPATLKQRALRAGGWSFAGYGLSQAIRLGGNLVMTRLLAPEMFGVMAMATMVLVILGMISDIGLRHTIIQSRRGDDPAFLDTAWVLQIGRGVALWLLALLLSGALYLANLAGIVPAQSVYAAPELPLVIAVNSLAAVILGFQSTRVATAHRRLEQKRLVQIELAGHLAALATMIALGTATRSIWAIVAGGLIGSLTATVLGHAWLSGHPNRFRWDQTSLHELIRFGKWLFVSSIMTVLAFNGDRLLLGGFVDAKVLGLYAIATLITGAVEGGLGKVFGAISLPALSEVARNEPWRLREVYYRLRIAGDLVLLFMAGLLFATGQLVIDILYDPRYSAAGGMLQVLALSLIGARYAIAYQVYIAVGKPGYLAIINAVRCAALFTLVPVLFYAAGTKGALWGIALHGLAMVPFVHGFNARLGLNDFRRELMVLVALPAGFFCGSATDLLR